MSTARNTTTRRHAAPARAATPGYACVVALSAVSSLLLAGCGGGGTDAVAAPLDAPKVAAAARVRLEGCVVDAQWMGASDVAVHVRTADGRAVGTAFTDARGVFVLDVPARTGIVVDTAVDAWGGLALNTGSESMSVAGCLLAGV